MRVGVVNGLVFYVGHSVQDSVACDWWTDDTYNLAQGVCGIER
jgi:hypothetical protein